MAFYAASSGIKIAAYMELLEVGVNFMQLLYFIPHENFDFSLLPHAW
jgi:hypothetical protein